MNATGNNFPDQYRDGGMDAIARIVKRYNPAIQVLSPYKDHPGSFRATHRNLVDNKLHWVYGIQMPDGSPRITRGTGVFAGDDDDNIVEGNVGRMYDLHEQETEEILEKEAWNVVLNFLEASGA